jgi:hypothetical protein
MRKRHPGREPESYDRNREDIRGVLRIEHAVARDGSQPRPSTQPLRNKEYTMSQCPDSVILFLIDGMRPDCLLTSSTPVMDRLVKSGASTFAARSVMPSVTLPCITSLFHSATPDTHGVATNKWTPTSHMPPSLFSVVRSKERRTASICNWEELRDLSPVGSLDTAIYIDNSYDSGGTGDRLIAELSRRGARDRI